ncbi:hypothetical protein G7Y89_g7557 [Cudoniella acicularis]|uniref:Semialdehyde dehydrogenase NAD-binding domain-containing protein n=1 Tax=Cudoniella acicularis TaxID=354080 RepID=A0A8H4W1V0_9HELO|nr:hypothetical protein G7Y89_g7557 [Cudoniella acicularis]
MLGDFSSRACQLIQESVDVFHFYLYSTCFFTSPSPSPPPSDLFVQHLTRQHPNRQYFRHSLSSRLDSYPEAFLLHDLLSTPACFYNLDIWIAAGSRPQGAKEHLCHELSSTIVDNLSSCLFRPAAVRCCGCLLEYLVTLNGATITLSRAGWPYIRPPHALEPIGGHGGRSRSAFGVDGFPDRLIREGLPGRLKRESVRRWDLPLEQMLDQQPDTRTMDIPLPRPKFPDVQKGAMIDENIPQSQSGLPRLPLNTTPETSAPQKVPGTGLEQSNDAPRPLEYLRDPHIEIQEDETSKSQEKAKDQTQQMEVEPSVTPRIEITPSSRSIHILGIGRVGKYIAHSIASLPHAPPVTLLVHNPSLFSQWYAEGAAIRVERNGKIYTQTGFSIEPSEQFRNVGNLVRSGIPIPTPSNNIIENLIVTTNAHATIAALSAIQHRLWPASTVCFLQDGLGIIDEVNLKIFPDRYRRPNYALGTVSHKIGPTSRTYSVVEKGPGAITFTVLPRDTIETYQGAQYGKPLVRRLDGDWAPFRLVTKTLQRSPDLQGHTVSRLDFQKVQLEKIIINSVIGPLSVVFDCTNDQLLYNYNVSSTMKILLEEIFQVVNLLPELIRAPLKHRLSEKAEERELSITMGICRSKRLPAGETKCIYRFRTNLDGLKSRDGTLGILGCTGSVGQRFILLLAQNPHFILHAVGASARSAGKKYKDAVKWKQATPMGKHVEELIVKECKANEFLEFDVIFSGLDADVASDIEMEFLKAELAVFSNAKNYRRDPLVPLVVPTVNLPYFDVIPH